MRILVLTNMFPPHYYGGYELSCQDVVRHWRAKGHHVQVLTTTMRVAGVEDPPCEWPDVRRVLEFYWADHALLNPPISRRLTIERSNRRRLLQTIREFRPDVVSVWHMGAMSLSLLAVLTQMQLPLVFNVCDDWLSYGPRLDAWTRIFTNRPLAGWLIAMVTRVPTQLPDLGQAGTFCFVSQATKGRAERASPWQFPIATVVYSGISRTDFPAIKEPPPPHKWRWRLLYVGRLDERKGIHDLLKALPLLPGEAQVSLLGRGDERYRVRLASMARRLRVDDRVSFGFVDRSQLRKHYREADALIFPSTWDEPFGLVPIEAMASGTPVVATGAGGSAEFLRDGVNCLLYPPGDAAKLAAALNQLASDSAVRSAVIRGGLQTAESLTAGRLADCLEEWHLAAARSYREGRPAHRKLSL